MLRNVNPIGYDTSIVILFYFFYNKLLQSVMRGHIQNV